MQTDVPCSSANASADSPARKKARGHTASSPIGLTATENSSVQGHNVQSRPVLETLAPEILQNIAGRLVNQENGHARFEGLLELRATSRLLRAKTDYVFKKSFGTHVVQFHHHNLVQLLEMAKSADVAPCVESLVFISSGEADGGQVAPTLEVKKPEIDKPAERETVEYKLLTDSGRLLVETLRRFPRLTALHVARSLNTTVFAQDASALEIPFHPTTMIFNSMLHAHINLQVFNMNVSMHSAQEGMYFAPLTTTILRKKNWSHLSALMTLDLCLSADLLLRDYHSLVALKTFLGHCKNLRTLGITLTAAALNATWPHHRTARQIWQVVACQRYARLRTVKLGGFGLDAMSLFAFLTAHAERLRTLQFNNCSLAGQWGPILSAVKFSPQFDSLILFQVSEGVWRMVWALMTVCSLERLYVQNQDAAAEEDWAVVEFVGNRGVGRRMQGRDPRAVIGSMLEERRLLPKTTHPMNPDAGRWLCMRLVGEAEAWTSPKALDKMRVLP